MNRSFLIALGVIVVLALWVGSGLLFSSSDRREADASASRQVFSVRASELTAQPFTRTVVVRGRTEAVRAVELRAEVEGQVVATPVEKGERVEEGALICRLSTYERQANLDEARALADQRRLEYDAAVELARKGHRSETMVAQAKAQYESALARVRQWEVALENTAIRAPFAGLLDDRSAEIGDFLQKGGICARLIDEDPFLVIGTVSQDEVDALLPGAEAEIRLVNGERRTGRIRYIAATADERTRTFRIEVAVPNPEHDMREGMSAEIQVPVETVTAHYLPPTLLVLDDGGRLGIRAVDGEGRVVFHPVKILSDDFEGMWVAGLPDSLRVITVGQEFVAAGEKVDVVLEGAGVG